LPKRKRRLVPNEEGILEDEISVRRAQRAAARAAEKEKAAKIAKAQARRRKAKGTRPNYKSMPEAEYILVRRNNWYASPRDEGIDDRGFWNEEQWGIFRDVYEPFKNPCRPMHPIDFDHLRSKSYFDEAISVIEKLGLLGLANIQCDYNPGLIKQFYATLVILPNAQKSMKWMTGEHECTSNFTTFASLLGYAYDGDTPVGRRIHNPGNKPDKDKLYDLYDSTGVVGFINGLHPLYDQLVRIFRENIAPSGGNNDAIRTSLVDLLAFAHECATSTDPAEDFTLDVMDFIFYEIKDAIIQRNTVPYAPYIMLLIKHVLGDYDIHDDCVEHKVKKMYIKRKAKSAPSAAYPDTFMADARTSATAREQRTAASVVSREVRKLSWFERNVLCMKVEIHRENYQAYVERKNIQDTQQLILHRLSGAQTADPTPSAPVAYEAWNVDRYNWVDMQRHLFDAPDATAGGSRTEAEEDFEPEEDFVDEDEDAGDDVGDGDDYDDVDSGDFDDGED
jgi:hypothetical protein